MSRRGVLELGRDWVALGVMRRRTTRWIERRWLSDGATLADMADLMLSHEQARRWRSVEIRVRPPLVQLRTLRDLPPARRRDLPRLVRGQASRYFRLGGAEAVVDAVPADGTGEASEVRAAAIELDVAELIHRSVARAGLELVALRPSGDGPDARLRLDPPGARRRRRQRGVRSVAVAVALAALGWATAGGVYVLDLYLDHRALKSELAQLEGPLDQIAAIRDRLEDFAPVARAIELQGPSGRWATERLARLAEALPASAHLMQVTLEREGPVRLEGRAGDPAGVITALEPLGWGVPTLTSPPIEVESEGRIWSTLSVQLVPARGRS